MKKKSYTKDEKDIIELFSDMDFAFNKIREHEGYYIESLKKNKNKKNFNMNMFQNEYYQDVYFEIMIALNHVNNCLKTIEEKKNISVIQKEIIVLNKEKLENYLKIVKEKLFDSSYNRYLDNDKKENYNIFIETEKITWIKGKQKLAQLINDLIEYNFISKGTDINVLISKHFNIYDKKKKKIENVNPDRLKDTRGKLNEKDSLYKRDDILNEIVKDLDKE